MTYDPHRVRIRFFRLAALAVGGGLLAVARAADPAPVADSSVVARIGDTEVKVADVRAALAALDPREQAALARDPAQLAQAVRSLLARRLLLQEAMARKWEEQPAVVAQLARVRDNALVETYLHAVATPPDNFPNEIELQSAYEANRATLAQPRQYRLAQIFISLPKGADAAATARAEVRLEAMRHALAAADADFAALARTGSEERDSAARGGEIGWLPEARIQPEIRAQVTGLPRNVPSDPVRLADGWHILKVLDVREPFTPSLDEVRPYLVQQLRAERARTNGQAYLAGLLQQKPVALNELVLGQIWPPPAGK